MARSIDEEQLSNGSIPSLFMKFAIPGVIGMLFIGLQVIIDGLIVGRLLGSSALASINIVLPLYSMSAAVMIIIGIGSQTIVSIGQGKRDYKMAQDAMTTGYVATLAFSLLISIIATIFAEKVVTLLGSNEVLFENSKSYLLGLFPFILPIGCAFYNDYMLRAMGRTKTGMALMSGAVILNVILNILFITLFDLGVFGVGLATSISFSLSAIISTIVLHRKNIRIHLTKGKFKIRLLINILYNGSSEGISEFAGGVTLLLFNLTLMKYIGEDGVAAFTIINYIYLVGVLIFIGISDGIIPIISYNYGAKQYDRCRETYRFTARCIGAIGVVIAAILTFGSSTILKVFFDDSSKHIEEIAVAGASIYAIAFLINGYNVLTASLFTAIADAKRSVIISALRGLVLMPIFISLVPLFFGIEYVWYALPLAELLTLGVSVVYYQNLKRRLH